MSFRACRDRRETSRIWASVNEPAPAISRSITNCGIRALVYTNGSLGSQKQEGRSPKPRQGWVMGKAFIRVQDHGRETERPACSGARLRVPKWESPYIRW